MSREILAADALCNSRLIRLSPVSITHPGQEPYSFVYPPNLRDSPPLVSLRLWLRAELTCRTAHCARAGASAARSSSHGRPTRRLSPQSRMPLS